MDRETKSILSQIYLYTACNSNKNSKRAFPGTWQVQVKIYIEEKLQNVQKDHDEQLCEVKDRGPAQPYTEISYKVMVTWTVWYSHRER